MKRKIIYYSPHLKVIAQNLRNKSTLSEVILWKFLKGKQRLGYDFHRQKPITIFVVDFYRNELRLAIEIDGVSHENKYEFDKERQCRMEKLGIRFLRFTDNNIKNNISSVINVIDNWIVKHTPLVPSREGNKRGV